jgi:hypothetical protein
MQKTAICLQLKDVSPEYRKQINNKIKWIKFILKIRLFSNYDKDEIIHGDTVWCNDQVYTIQEIFKKYKGQHSWTTKYKLENDTNTINGISKSEFNRFSVNFSINRMIKINHHNNNLCEFKYKYLYDRLDIDHDSKIPLQRLELIAFQRYLDLTLLNKDLINLAKNFHDIYDKNLENENTRHLFQDNFIYLKVDNSFIDSGNYTGIYVKTDNIWKNPITGACINKMNNSTWCIKYNNIAIFTTTTDSHTLPIDNNIKWEYCSFKHMNCPEIKFYQLYISRDNIFLEVLKGFHNLKNILSLKYANRTKSIIIFKNAIY